MITPGMPCGATSSTNTVLRAGRSVRSTSHENVRLTTKAKISAPPEKTIVVPSTL